MKVYWTIGGILVLLAGVLVLGVGGTAWFWLKFTDVYQNDPEQVHARSQQLVGRWDSPVAAPRGSQFSWIFTADGRYEFKTDFRRPADALTWYYTEDKGMWKFIGVNGNRIKLRLSPGTFGSEVVFECPHDPNDQPKAIFWWKYSDFDYQLHAYPLQATPVDDDSWKQ
jgi:hypothetical protein